MKSCTGNCAGTGMFSRAEDSCPCFIKSEWGDSMKSISLYTDNGSFLTKLEPFDKLFYVIAAIVAPLIAGDLTAFLIPIAISFALLVHSRLLKRALPLTVVGLSLVLTVLIVQGIFSQKNVTPLVHLGPVTFYREGCLIAARIGMNVMNMFFSFACFVLSTRPSDLVEDMERIGFSPKFGYVVNSVFQIIPQMTGAVGTITDAQRSRGLETEGNLITRARAFIPLISPVVMSSLINTRERAIALEVRGFEADAKKTFLREKRKKASSLWIRLFCVILLAAAIVWRVL